MADFDHELFVETANTWQTLTCPGCGNDFQELLQDDTKVGASSCPECNEMIEYRFDRETNDREQPDTTEQTSLLDE